MFNKNNKIYSEEKTEYSQMSPKTCYFNIQKKWNETLHKIQFQKD